MYSTVNNWSESGQHRADHPNRTHFLIGHILIGHILIVKAINGKRGALAGDSAQLSLGGGADGIAAEVELGHGGVLTK